MIETIFLILIGAAVVAGLTIMFRVWHGDFD
jgi:hypothetical protein